MYICTGVEYNVSQLADVCVAAVVVSDLDAACPSALRCSLLSLHSSVRTRSLLPPVRLGHGPRDGTAQTHRHHEPSTAGSGPGTVPLSATRSHGEDTTRHKHMPFLLCCAIVSSQVMTPCNAITIAERNAETVGL